MRTDRRTTARRKANVGPAAWLYRLGVAACLGACAIGGPPALQAQSVPANRPTALEQLRVIVGLDPARVRPARSGTGAAEQRPISEPRAPVVAVERRLPPRLDRVERSLETLEAMNRTAAPALFPVEALSSAREVVPTIHEMPTATPVQAENAPTHAVIRPAPSPGVVTWGAGKAIRCLALIGTFCMAAAALGSRWSSLLARLRAHSDPLA